MQESIQGHVLLLNTSICNFSNFSGNSFDWYKANNITTLANKNWQPEEQYQFSNVANLFHPRYISALFSPSDSDVP